MGISSRRTFLKATGAFAAAASAGVHRVAAQSQAMPIGLELYSVRELLPKDFDGTLAQVRAAGYTVAEAAGFYNRSAADFRASLDKAGIRCISAHYTLSLLQSQLDSLIEYARNLGLEYMICSSSGGTHRDPSVKGPDTLDDWRWRADEFNRIGEKVKAAGMTFGVHNHIPEFAVFDGTIVYNELLRITDPRLVVFEMDAGWVIAAGYNPIDYLKQSPERFPLMHIKEVLHGPDGKFHAKVVGQGMLNYAPILRAATGLKQYFIEQEEFEMDPMQELRLEADYMRSLKV
ncbi:MAG TPA: sugar phosphate isomerase/epimerase [Terracidiphilus sp.]|nr:sugar phosphate isomerase/epimerase [Terracidiphilus sp.]